MQKFIGVKLVMAVAMSRGSFVEHTRQEKLIQGNGSDEGYLVEYLDGGKPNYPDKHDNFISWCPKEQFENANRPTEGMTFGMAVEAIKKGWRVARKGWNGSDMFIYYVPEAKYPAHRNKFGTMKGLFPGDMVPYRAYMALKTAQNDVAAWTPSGSDALAEDWVIVE